jgi:hypothetical protein
MIIIGESRMVLERSMAVFIVKGGTGLMEGL